MNQTLQNAIKLHQVKTDDKMRTIYQHIKASQLTSDFTVQLQSLMAA